VRHNVRLLKPERAELLAVVKADGYGHGDAPVARAALEAGATRIGGALGEEGLGLRERGIEAPIRVRSEGPAGSERARRRLTPSVYTPEDRTRSEAAGSIGRRWAHEADTGIARRVSLRRRRPRRALILVPASAEGLWTPPPREDELGTREQLPGSRGGRLAPRVSRRRCPCTIAATLLYPEAHLDPVRPGAAVWHRPRRRHRFARGPPRAHLPPSVTMVAPARRRRLSYGWIRPSVRFDCSPAGRAWDVS
jgi:alanine racemase